MVWYGMVCGGMVEVWYGFSTCILFCYFSVANFDLGGPLGGLARELLENTELKVRMLYYSIFLLIVAHQVDENGRLQVGFAVPQSGGCQCNGLGTVQIFNTNISNQIYDSINITYLTLHQ